MKTQIEIIKDMIKQSTIKGELEKQAHQVAVLKYLRGK